MVAGSGVFLTDGHGTKWGDETGAPQFISSLAVRATLEMRLDVI
jgi:hypothetical protein